MRNILACLSIAALTTPATAQSVTIGSAGLGCLQHETLDTLFAMDRGGQRAEADALVAAHLIRGTCRDLEGRTVSLRSGGLYYSQVIDKDGSLWWVLASQARKR